MNNHNRGVNTMRVKLRILCCEIYLFGLEQKFVAFLALKFLYLKISIFYKISMIPFDRVKFQLSESVLQITIR